MTPLSPPGRPGILLLTKHRSSPKHHTQDDGAAPDSDYGSDIDDGYDAAYYGDAADREALAKMTELDREMVLSDRAEARDRELERRGLTVTDGVLREEALAVFRDFAASGALVYNAGGGGRSPLV